MSPNEAFYQTTYKNDGFRTQRNYPNEEMVDLWEGGISQQNGLSVQISLF